MKCCLLPVICAMWACGRLMAVPVEIRASVVSGTVLDGFSLESAVDRIQPAGKGWRLAAPDLAAEQTAIFLPVQPVSARQLLLQLFFPGPDPLTYFGKFGIDVTTDAEPAPGGRWMPLILEPATAEDPSVTMDATPVVVLDQRQAPFVLTMRSRVPFDGISGFRLRLFPDESTGGSPLLGRAADGGFLLGEFRVETDAPRSSNLALGRQVYCSRQVAAGHPSRHLSDGFHATWSQPEWRPEDPDAFFQMDLGQTMPLNHLVIRWHQGGGAPGLPLGYDVELLSESGGHDGTQLWAAHRGPERIGAADVIRGTDGTGEFAGRSLMIKVKGGPGDQPRIAEIEVYPALRPVAERWLADGRALEQEEHWEIPAGTRELSFVPVCGLPVEGVTRCRWKLEGWKPEWQEAALGGPVILNPAPPPGTYQLLLEARHSDGVWDKTGMPWPVRAAAPWWNHAPSVLAAVSGFVVAAAAGGWFLFARRLRRRLVHTEQHLELHRDRLRISRDMHDEIGARLTSIALLAERTQRQPQDSPHLLTDLASQARNTVEALDTIVWAVNPRHDSAGGLADYLSDYVPDYLAAAGIECELDFCIATPDQPLALAIRHNLLMATKEALRNVVLHSGAAHCRVSLTDAARRLEITVSDDGCGFQPNKDAGISHTGLESMKQRLMESNGTCVFDSRPGSGGTRVRLSVPLTDF